MATRYNIYYLFLGCDIGVKKIVYLNTIREKQVWFRVEHKFDVIREVKIMITEKEAEGIMACLMKGFLKTLLGKEPWL